MTQIATLKKGHTLLDDPTDYLSLIEALGGWRAEKGYAPQVLSYWLRHQSRCEYQPALETLLGRFLMRLRLDNLVSFPTAVCCSSGITAW